MRRLKTGIETITLRHRFQIARGFEDTNRVVIAEIDSDGKRGYGEASPSSYYGETPEAVVEALAGIGDWLDGQDLRRFRHVLEEAAERLSSRAALCALDTALFDWISHDLGVPIYRLLGLDPRRAPVSSFTIGIAEPEVMVAKLREAKGYPIYKIKVGTERDLDVLRRLRKETDATFRVDANCGWTVEETIERSAELESLGVEFIEQPLPPDQLEAMDEVFAKSALPVIADENSIVPEDIPALRGRFHGINIKLVKCGGILPALRMVHLARAFGMRVMFGCMIETSVLIHAAAQLGALADYLDLDGNVLITDDPFEGMENDFGRLTLPQGWIQRRTEA